MKQQDRGTAKNRKLNEENRYNWNKATLTRILKRQEYCGDVVNFKTEKHYKDKRNHYVDKDKWQIIENVHEPIIDRITFENVQRILKKRTCKKTKWRRRNPRIIGTDVLQRLRYKNAHPHHTQKRKSTACNLL